MAYWLYAVTKTTCVCGEASAAAAATSSPVMPGMRMSRNATSGRWTSIASRADAPSSHSATISSSGQARRTWETSSARSSAWSSATMALGMCGDDDTRGDAVREIRADVERRVDSMRELEAFAHVLQSHAGPRAVAAKAAAVVGDGDRDLAFRFARDDPDGAAARERLQAMLDGILDQRLQHHRRHRRGAQRIGDLHLHGEALAHADLHDLEIGARA